MEVSSANLILNYNFPFLNETWKLFTSILRQNFVCTGISKSYFSVNVSSLKVIVDNLLAIWLTTEDVSPEYWLKDFNAFTYQYWL